MITRAQYMADSTKLHQAYYAEVAEALGIRFRKDDPLLDRVRKALADGDEPLNTIPLGQWDAMALGYRFRPETRKALRERGEGWSLGTGVCAYKAAARAAAQKEQR